MDRSAQVARPRNLHAVKCKLLKMNAARFQYILQILGADSEVAIYLYLIYQLLSARPAGAARWGNMVLQRMVLGTAEDRECSFWNAKK